MRSLVLGLLVLALGAGGYYAWRHRPEPTRPPLFAGEPPKLDVPASRVSVPKPGSDAVLVAPESLGSADPRAVKGQDPRERPIGSTALLIPGGTAPPAPLDTPGAPERIVPVEAPPKPPTWLDKLASPGGAACLLVIAAVVYFGVTRGLRREPGAGA